MPAILERSNEAPARVPEAEPVPGVREALAYDAMAARNRRVMAGQFVGLLERMGLRSGRVLDIGCGPGRIALELARLNPGLRVTGVDASPAMLDVARRNARHAGLADRVRFVKGSTEALPFKTGSFDWVVSQFLLHHLPRPEALLSEAARVRASGGRIAIKDLHRPPAWMMPAAGLFARFACGYDGEETRMFCDSLKASFSLTEIRGLLQRNALPGARAERLCGMYLLLTA